jgi:hypothetical protein
LQQIANPESDKMPMFQDKDRPSPELVRNMAAMTERLGVATVQAVWPTGVSHLAQAIIACQRCDSGDVCGDWLARAPNQIGLPPAFCPNAPALTRVKQAKERG